MKISYKLTNFLNNETIYGVNFRYMHTLKFYVVEDIHLYHPDKRLECIIKSNKIIELENMQNESNLKEGLYEIYGIDYYGYLVSKEELNAKTIPIYIKTNSYDEDYDFHIEGIEIRKKGYLFNVYRTPKLKNDAKKIHYMYIDSILKKMFLNCGDIVLNSHINMILKNVKEFDKLFIKTNNAKLCMEMKDYLEKAYDCMLKTEKKDIQIKTAKEYFELNFSELNEDSFLTELKLKKQFLDMI